jgi:dihydrofolate reductase
VASTLRSSPKSLSHCGRPRVIPHATKLEVVDKIVYLGRNYHFGPHKISMYPKRYPDIEVSPSLADARAAAGDKNVGIWGGANTVTQYLQAGLLDELQIHVIPILLGNGVRLFQDLSPAGIELTKTRSIDTPRATHLRFSVLT